MCECCSPSDRWSIPLHITNLFTVIMCLSLLRSTQFGRSVRSKWTQELDTASSIAVIIFRISVQFPSKKIGSWVPWIWSANLLNESMRHSRTSLYFKIHSLMIQSRKRLVCEKYERWLTSEFIYGFANEWCFEGFTLCKVDWDVTHYAGKPWSLNAKTLTVEKRRTFVKRCFAELTFCHLTFRSLLPFGPMQH